MENSWLGRFRPEQFIVLKEKVHGALARVPKKAFTLSVLALVGVLVATLLLLGRTPPASPMSEVYTLVPDKVSQSAGIPLSLPEGVFINNFDPARSVRFSPEIRGRWEIAGEKHDTYRFLPETKLAVGSYYLATLSTPEIGLEKMFSVDVDPSVLAVFPREGVDANEFSDITIMFSRPMVPLSTLAVNADVIVPIEISPKTEGRWKWISTRALQFIPKTHLLRSSQYSVVVKNGLLSLDGVPVPEFSHTFTTRTLGYVRTPEASVIPHTEPIRLYFNQPVDLDRTRTFITITQHHSTVEMPSAKAFLLAYGTRRSYDEKTKKELTLTDKSVVEIYSESDEHGRKYLWDADASYGVAIGEIVPLEGDRPFLWSGTFSVRTLPLITGVSAESARSNLVSSTMFDPEGTLTLHTGEDIDLSRSPITGKGVREVVYGKKCADEEYGRYDRDCVTVPDKRSLVISFSPDSFGPSETASVSIEKLVNTDGVILNNEPIVQQFTTYPKLVVIKTMPKAGDKKAPLNMLRICSNAPLLRPQDDEFYKKVSANMMLGKWNWSGSYLVQNLAYQNEGDTPHCPVGTYETSVSYGLVPNYAYEMTLSLDDHFGGHAEQTLAFTTRDADPRAKGIVHMQNQVLVTTPDRTKLAYGLDFMDEIDVAVCTVSAKDMLLLETRRPAMTTSVEKLPCKRTYKKHLTLAKGPATRKYLTIDLHDFEQNPMGHYVLVISNPGYREIIREWVPEPGGKWGGKTVEKQGDMLYEKTFLTATNLSVVSKEVERSPLWEASLRSFMKGRWPENLYWVNDMKTLRPVYGATVLPYTQTNDGIAPGESATTDTAGIATAPSRDDVIGAVVRYGTESAIIANSTDSLSWTREAGPQRREYVYTDRPIYRPGDTVHIKGISRIGFDGRYDLASGTTTVEIRDPMYEIARTEKVTMGENGTYEVSFLLDNKAPLGYYGISANTGGYGSFRVEEYVAPDFKVEIATDKEEYISGDTANLGISANYYFGVPLEGGDVEYRIVSQDYYFDRYTKNDFSFDGGWYWNENGWYGDKYITGGKLTLGKDGKAKFASELSLDKLFGENYRDKSKIFTVSVTVKNRSGQSVSGRRSFIVHRGLYYAGLAMNNYYYASKQPATLRIKTVDTKGANMRVKDLRVTISKVEWKSYKRQEVDGNFYYRTEKVRTTISDRTIDTDKEGNATEEFTTGDAGEYEVRVAGIDEQKNTVTATYNFYVFGEGYVEVKPTNNASLELTAMKTDLAVGDTGSFVITSPFPKAKALVTLSRESILRREVISLDHQITPYEFPVTEDYIPGFTAEVLLLAPSPEIKYGALPYRVLAKEKELLISVTGEKNAYLPGEDVTLLLHASDSQGKPAKAELSLAVVNMNVLALVGNPKKDLLPFFYGYAPLAIGTASNIKNILTVAEIPVGTKGGSGGGGDDLEKKKRGIFRDTAEWRGAVMTNEKGDATVRFTLPDNLTEWQAESVGVTKDTKVGAGYGTFVSRKTLMALPLKPRFILPGDVFSVGGTIFNESDDAQKVVVGVDTASLLLGEHEVTLTIPPHESLSVSFPVRAPDSVESGTHRFTLSAKNEKYEDVVESEFPIKRNEVFEFTATAGRVTENAWKEEVFLPSSVVKERGSLTISLSATMANILDSAVRGMLIYPYECSEQTASKLRTIAIVKRHASLFGTESAMLPPTVDRDGKLHTAEEIVEEGLAKLYLNENPGGGVSYYAGLPEDFPLTVAVLETYIDLKRAGYKVDEVKMKTSAGFVYNRINFAPTSVTESFSKEMLIAGVYTLSRMDDPSYMSDTMRANILRIISDKKAVHEELSIRALSYLTILGKEWGASASLMKNLYAEFENRSHIDGRGTVISGGQNVPWGLFVDDIGNSALALKAFSETRYDSPLLEGLVRAIKNGKTRDGGWTSTQGSVIVIDALTEYLTWKKEAEAHLAVSVGMNGENLLSGEWEPKSVGRSFATTVPMEKFKIGNNQIINFTKRDLGKHADAYYYDMFLRYYLSADAIPPRDEGFSVERALYRLDDTEFANPVLRATQGEVLRGRLIIRTPRIRSHVTVEDFVPAGVEIINQSLATEDQTLENTDGYGGGYRGALGMETSAPTKNKVWSSLATVFSFGGNEAGPNQKSDGEVTDEMYANRSSVLARLYPNAVEKHDDRIFAYISTLPEGEYVYEYYVRALIPGTYQYLPAVASEMYTPENFGRTRGNTFTVEKSSN